MLRIVATKTNSRNNRIGFVQHMPTEFWWKQDLQSETFPNFYHAFHAQWNFFQISALGNHWQRISYEQQGSNSSLQTKKFWHGDLVGKVFNGFSILVVGHVGPRQNITGKTQRDCNKKLLASKLKIQLRKKTFLFRQIFVNGSWDKLKEKKQLIILAAKAISSHQGNSLDSSDYLEKLVFFSQVKILHFGTLPQRVCAVILREGRSRKMVSYDWQKSTLNVSTFSRVHWYFQVASILTFIWEGPSKHIFLKSMGSTAAKKVLVNNVERILPKKTLYDSKKYVLPASLLPKCSISSTKSLAEKLKSLNHRDFIEWCSRKRANTIASFNSLKFRQLLLPCSRKFPLGVETRYC